MNFQSAPVITGVGVIASNGIGRENFWQALRKGESGIGRISRFDPEKFPLKTAGEIKGFCPQKTLGPKKLRNLNLSTLMLMAAAQEAINEAGLKLTGEDAVRTGICVASAFSNIDSIIDFDREVYEFGPEAANPALFPSTVINGASSQSAIRFNIRGFNTTISNGFSSGLDTLFYSGSALERKEVHTVLCGAVDSLNYPLYYGLYRLKYMAGLKGEALSCPFDKRRNGPVFGEAAGMVCIQDKEHVRRNNGKIMAVVKGVSHFFDFDNPEEGMARAIGNALEQAGTSCSEIDYVSSSANSCKKGDALQVKALKKVFGGKLKSIPVSSIKSMVGETFSSSGILQLISCLGAMEKSFIPPTLNYKIPSPECDIDCVPDKARIKEINTVLIVCHGLGGYNSACVLEKYGGN